MKLKTEYDELDLLEYTEEQINKLFEAGKADDDDVQRWYDLQEEVQYLMQDFIENELELYTLA